MDGQVNIIIWVAPGKGSILVFILGHFGVEDVEDVVEIRADSLFDAPRCVLASPNEILVVPVR